MFNQFTESFSVGRAGRRRSRTRPAGPRSCTSTTRRVELEEHYYRAAHTKLLDLGLLPFLLGDELLADLLSIARAHIDRLERSALRAEGVVALHVEQHLPHREAAGGGLALGATRSDSEDIPRVTG